MICKFYLNNRTDKNVLFGLVSLFNGIINLQELFNARFILIEELKWYYLTHTPVNRKFYVFLERYSSENERNSATGV